MWPQIGYGLVLGAALGLSAPALGSTIAALQDALATSEPMIEGARTRAPLAFARFCRRLPAECGERPARSDRSERNSAPPPPVLSAEALGELERVNGEVNRSIRPVPDARRGRRDTWSVAPRRGDCEDYALTKRHRLMAAGWPAHALLVTVVRDQRERLHAVLVVRTDRGELVLDNLSARIEPWDQLPYRWIKRQSATDPRRWVQLVGYGAEMAERVMLRLRRLTARKLASQE